MSGAPADCGAGHRRRRSLKPFLAPGSGSEAGPGSRPSPKPWPGFPSEGEAGGECGAARMGLVGSTAVGEEALRQVSTYFPAGMYRCFLFADNAY